MDVEQTHMIGVVASPEPGDTDIMLSCRRCDWSVWLDASDGLERMHLADLIDAADAHFDAADHR